VPKRSLHWKTGVGIRRGEAGSGFITWLPVHRLDEKPRLLIVGIGCAGQSSEAPVSLEDFSKHLDECIPRLMDRYDIPGVSMALLTRGELVWSGAYG
jgi:hypothetical protein